MKSGFTLVELLIVLVIFGVLAAVIGPSFSSGSESARVRAAARGALQVSRYARTMAVLHQKPVELTFSSDGHLSVSIASSGGESLVSAQAFAVTNAAAAEDEALAKEVEAKDALEGGAEYTMADVNVTKVYEEVTFVFLEYTDSVDDGRYERLPTGRDEKQEKGEDALERDVTRASVLYRSNGTCRPYKVRIAGVDEGAFSLTMAVDRLGAVRIEEDEEERQ